MPTHKRPEMLALALEKISNSENQVDDVRIFADTDCNIEEVEFVRDEYCPRALIFHARPHVSVPSGMWNILQALKAGYETKAEYVFLIEEDVLVGRNFFNWHFTAQAANDYFATCGRRMRHLPSYNQYTNPGSCFKRGSLSLVVEHINDSLFENRQAYMDRTFGPMPEVSDLDDGLIRRIAKFYGLSVLYPDTPQCAHIGFRAYNHYMDWVNTGNIEQRISKLRTMLSEIDPNNRFTGDFEPILLS
ncbi:MAG TPA: hypothetical protein VFA52_04555 [Candidatus Paceibacterota bacterium]|nr:hypothetical protein [Candidatus Paceibacterota bacterium]